MHVVNTYIELRAVNTQWKYAIFDPLNFAVLTRDKFYGALTRDIQWKIYTVWTRDMNCALLPYTWITRCSTCKIISKIYAMEIRDIQSNELRGVKTSYILSVVNTPHSIQKFTQCENDMNYAVLSWITRCSTRKIVSKIYAVLTLHMFYALLTRNMIYSVFTCVII
jgi:hypothetical protein